MQNLTSQQILKFQQSINLWYQRHGRKDLPWQLATTPYRVWISEVMLQQTQVETVIPYFSRFIQEFPDITTLAKADIDTLMHLWTGLGYYARARNLHKSANILIHDFSAKLPEAIDQLMLLPGIGRSTAGAIRSLGFNKSAPILDGNVKRVLARHYSIKGWPGKPAVMQQLWAISEKLTPSPNSAQFNQAMMDIGSLICHRTKPDCKQCPLMQTCTANARAEIDLFPEKKPSKVKPVKQQHFYLITNSEGMILIYHRPPAGIWGGLWCLPDASQQLDETIVSNSVKPISSFTHQFTHFTLQAQVSTARLNTTHEVMDAANWSWYDPTDPAKIGIPTPIIPFLQTNKAS